MKKRIEDEFYFWCCDWCDTENLVLWSLVQDGPSCGACHRPLRLRDIVPGAMGGSINAGL